MATETVTLLAGGPVTGTVTATATVGGALGRWVGVGNLNFFVAAAIKGSVGPCFRER